MPTSSSAALIERKRPLKVKHHPIQNRETDSASQKSDKNFLTIEPAFNNKRLLYKRSHSTLNLKDQNALSDPVNVQTDANGIIYISRTQNQKEKNPDRISLDRRGLTTVPVVKNESRIRLLSMQHNLITTLDDFTGQTFDNLVFLDIYDNQLEKVSGVDGLINLRVLLMGKNRIKKMDGLANLKKVEVLDLHGNQISHISGLTGLIDLKVLNLAGNVIKSVGVHDLLGLNALEELNLRRNRLKKCLGFSETPNLVKLFLSNNELQTIEDISSVAKATNLKEICVDNNPVSLASECVSFLVSYLSNLTKLNTMLVNDQVRKAAMAWRRNKESSNAVYMDLTSDVCLNVKREEIISNARTNWELIRSQTKCLTTKVSCLSKNSSLKPENDIILTSLTKRTDNNAIKPKVRVPLLPDKPFLGRTSSQDTENSNYTSSSTNSSNEFFRLPPILVPILNKLEIGIKKCDSLSSIGANVDSCESSFGSSESDSEGENFDVKDEPKKDINDDGLKLDAVPIIEETNHKSASDTSSNISCGTGTSGSNSNRTPSISGGGNSELRVKITRRPRSIKSAFNSKTVTHTSKIMNRAATAKFVKPKKIISPANKDREQGGDYLIEICGRHLNIYGQGALRFIDKSWNVTKAQDVNTVKFNYVNFNTIIGVLNKLKHRFPNIENFIFKETNIQFLGQLNALSEVQGLTSLDIDTDGNIITVKDWKNYAIYRLSHWGLKILNGVEVTEEEVKFANDEYQSLSDIVLWSLPDVLLQPLLARLRIDASINEQNPKKWLISADPALKSVISKEALQWKKGTITQEDLLIRQKAKMHVSSILEEMQNSIDKLRLLDQQWPFIFHEFVRNTLLDYSHLDIYMKKKMQEFQK